MSKAQIYFCHGNELGAWTNVVSNFWNHCEKKGSNWGSDKQVRNLFPRGKVYDKLHMIQFEKHTGSFEDD